MIDLSTTVEVTRILQIYQNSKLNLLDIVVPWFERVRNFICENLSNEFFTSTITAAEYLPLHIRHGDLAKINEYETFKQLLKIKTIETTDSISIMAASIRARHKAIKGMDAIHLATCKVMTCDIFLTNDRQLLQVNEVQTILVDDL